MRRNVQLDGKDRQLLGLLRQDARLATAALARELGVARTTVVARLKRLTQTGIISGYTVRLNSEMHKRVLRVHALLNIDAKKGDAVVHALRAISQVRAVFAISGAMDCLALIEADTTDEIDSVLDAIGAIHGVEKTQSSLVLSVKFDRR
jgi:DNA-binding Lrp family transcriptional regulator